MNFGKFLIVYAIAIFVCVVEIVGIHALLVPTTSPTSSKTTAIVSSHPVPENKNDVKTKPSVEAPKEQQISASNNQLAGKNNQDSPPDWTMRFTGGIFVVGFFQLLLFYRQLRIMQISLNGAEDAAKTAKISATATRDIVLTLQNNAKKQMRAYLSILGAICVPQDRNTGWKFEIRMTIRNTGFTPAHAVNFQVRAKIIDSDLSDDINLSLDVGQDEGRGHISYGQENIIRAWLDDLITDEEIYEIKYGSNLKIYVYGTIWYKDVFGDTHKTNFCQIGIWDVKGNFSTVNYHRHNEAS